MKVRYKGIEVNTGEYSYETKYLNIFEEYLVYGIEEIRGIKYFLIVHNKTCYYPNYYDSSLFDIIDNKLSKYWKINLVNGDLKILFDDWLAVPNYMQYYVNGDIDEDESFYTLNEFIEYQKLIEDER